MSNRWLYFLIAGLGVLVAAKQPETWWSALQLIGGITLAGCTAVKALQSTPPPPKEPKEPDLEEIELARLKRTGLPS